MVRFVSLDGRRCRVCDQEPRFFHENDDGTVTCCRHLSAEHDTYLAYEHMERSEGASE